VDGADEVSAVEQASLRFDRLVSMAEAARATAAQLPSPDGYHWFQPWANMLAAVRAQTRQAIAPHLSQAESQVSHTSEEQISKVSEQLDIWLEDCRKTLPGAELKPDESKTSPSLTSSFLAASATDNWTYYVAQGGSDRLVLQMRSLEFTATQARIIGLLLIAVSLAATLWLARWPAAIDFFCRWPQALGILVAIAYWAWLWPSWLGIVIGAVSVWFALRFDWPGRSLRTEASTVLRAARQA
jgi:hypothetical protein